MMAKSKVERMTCQNTCSSWMTYQKRQNLLECANSPVYGDPKLLLKKKLSETNKISQLSKLKDTERIVAALSQIINTMKDLQRLASEHRVESKLYSGDGLEWIYQSFLPYIATPTRIQETQKHWLITSIISNL